MVDQCDVFDSGPYPWEGPDEGPTVWLRKNIPDALHYVHRRTKIKKDGTRVWYFQCSFGGRSRAHVYKTKKSVHSCCANFQVRAFGDSADIRFGFFEHSHEISKEYVSSWVRPDGDVCDQIIEMTQKGYTPSHIRKALSLTVPSQMFYNIRRPALAEAKTNRLRGLQEILNAVSVESCPAFRRERWGW